MTHPVDDVVLHCLVGVEVLGPRDVLGDLLLAMAGVLGQQPHLQAQRAQQVRRGTAGTAGSLQEPLQKTSMVGTSSRVQLGGKGWGGRCGRPDRQA